MSRFNIRTTLAVVGAAALLVAGTDLVTYAATGSSLVTGQINKASRPTTISNTGRGPALSLKNRASYPPLKVSSSKRVAKLNADRLDGRDSKDLEPGVIRAVLAKQGTTMKQDIAWKAIRVPAGSYLVTMHGIVGNATNDGWFSCILADAERTFTSSGTNLGGVMVATTADLTKDTSSSVFGGSNVYTIASGHRVIYGCQGGGSTAGPKVDMPVTVTLRKVNRPVTKVGSKYTPPPSESSRDLSKLID